MTCLVPPTFPLLHRTWSQCGLPVPPPQQQYALLATRYRLSFTRRGPQSPVISHPRLALPPTSPQTQWHEQNKGSQLCPTVTVTSSNLVKTHNEKESGSFSSNKEWQNAQHVKYKELRLKKKKYELKRFTYQEIIINAFYLMHQWSVHVYRISLAPTPKFIFIFSHWIEK